MKKQFKHTQGKWHVTPNGQYVGTLGDKKRPVAEIAFKSTEEGKANAKLIAAAPELLQALKEAKKSLQFLAEKGYWNAECATMIQVKEAINKATK